MALISKLGHYCFFYCQFILTKFVNTNKESFKTIIHSFKMFTIKRKISFYDCDPAGILFFGRVYQLCHSAYEEMIDSFNLNYDYWTNENFIVPIIKSEASYHKPIQYREEVSVEIKVKQLKSTSFELEYKCKNTKGEKCVVVNTIHVFVDKNTWKKKEITSEVKDGLSAHLVS